MCRMAASSLEISVLRLGEHEHLHGRLDAGVVVQVVPAFALCAVPLRREKKKQGPVGGSYFENPYLG